MENQSRGEASQDENVFKVVLKVCPGVVLGEELEFLTPSEEYVFKDIPDTDNENAIGIQITGIIRGTVLDKAIETAESFADGFLSYLSYLSRTSIGRPSVIKGYEISPGKLVGEYVQFYYDWKIPMYSPRSIRSKDVDKIILSFQNLSSAVIRGAKRAIHWYREGVRSIAHFDKFISFFIALESLNMFLRDHYELKVEYHECRNPECEQKSDFPTLNGVRTHIKNLYPDLKYWKRIRRLRNDITHGEVAFDDILEEVIQLLPIIENCLVKALDLLFGIEEYEYQKGLSLTSEKPNVGSIRIEVSGPDLAMLKEKEPDISVEMTGMKRTERGVVESDIAVVGRITSGYDIEVTRINRRQEGYLAELDFKRMRFSIEHEV